MTVVITGGAGFIGSNLCDALLGRGEQVVCIDNFDAYYDPAQKRANIAHLLKNPGFSLMECDVRDSAAIKQIFDRYRPTHVAHLAALAGVRASIERAALYADVNINGSISLLDAARASGVENFVQASTSSIYGATSRIPFQETDRTDHPLAPYPATKKACEVMAHAYHNMFDLNVTVLRFFSVYGPRVRPDMMAYMVMDRIVREQEITLFDQGDMQRDWTYIDDVCQGIVLALDTPLGYEVLNIGRGEPVRVRDFITSIEQLIGRTAHIKHVPTPASEPPITFASIDKAQRLLGYQPSVSVREGMEKTWEWYQSGR